jgi:hypothetical protein
MRTLQLQFRHGQISIGQILQNVDTDKRVAGLRVIDLLVLVLGSDLRTAMRTAVDLGIVPTRRLRRLEDHERSALLRLFGEEADQHKVAPPSRSSRTPFSRRADDVGLGASARSAKPPAENAYRRAKWESWWETVGPPWNVDDLTPSIERIRSRLDTTDFSTYEGAITRAVLGGALVAEYELNGSMPSLSEANVLLERVSRHVDPLSENLLPEKSANLRIITAVNLSSAKIAFFQRYGRASYLEGALEILLEAIGKTGEHRRNKIKKSSVPPSLMLAASEVYRLLFEHTGDVQFLDSSIKYAQRTYKVEKSPDKQSSLAASLIARFELNGDAADLDEAILLLSSALAHTSIDAPDTPRLQSNLASALRRRGQFEDLEKAVDLLRTALALTSDESPTRRALEINAMNLAAAAAG